MTIKNILIFHILIFLLYPVFARQGFCAKIIPLPNLKQAETISIDDSQLYITEEASVFIYSLNDWKRIKTFGRSGEGPAEFKTTIYRGLYLLLRKNYIIVDSYGRLSYFTKDGQFKAEFKTVPSVGKYVFLGNNLVGLGFKRYDKVNYFTFTLFDFQNNSKKEIYRYVHPYQPMSHYNPLETTRVATYVSYADKFYLRGEKNTILVFDPTGKQLAPLRFPYHEVKFTDKHKDYYITWYKTDPKFKEIYERDKRWIQFPEQFPVIRDFMIADEKIYVLTYETKDEKYRLLVLNLNGKLLQETFVPLEEENAFRLFPFTVKNGILYQVIENDEEEIWELHIHPISG